MVSARRIAQLASKWRRMAALGRKRLAVPPAACSTSAAVAGRGHCMVYAADGARFEVPLAFLGTALFGELLRMAHEEFGFAGDGGRITLPCDAQVVEYALCLLGRDASPEMEKAFLSSMAMSCHHASWAAAPVGAGVNQHAAVCSS